MIIITLQKKKKKNDLLNAQTKRQFSNREYQSVGFDWIEIFDRKVC